VILISSCFDPPEFSIAPEISLSRITFGETPDVSEVDSILLVINFKDGDGDLGLDANLPEHSEYPYHRYNYYTADGGDIHPIYSKFITDDIAVLEFGNVSGRLVMDDLATDPQYDPKLPPFVIPSCFYHEMTDTTVVAKASDIDRIPEEYRGDQLITIGGQNYVVIKGYMYRTVNENNFNIIVRMFEQVGTNTFQEIFFNDGCEPQFAGRFPILSTEDDSPLEGILSYSMYSVGFKPVLAPKYFRFEITVTDRALHTTEPLVTRVYTLDELRR
jgi:hypothetical protein